jgi:hypothetical protein
MASRQRSRAALWAIDAAILAYVAVIYLLAALTMAGVIPAIPLLRSGVLSSVGVALLATTTTVAIVAGWRAHGRK